MDASHVLNRWVTFRVMDVQFPDYSVIIQELHRSDILQGKVVAFSDSGEPGQAYVVVEVDGINQPVVVPLTEIREAYLHD
jgi:hypothetical protein